MSVKAAETDLGAMLRVLADFVDQNPQSSIHDLAKLYREGVPTPLGAAKPSKSARKARKSSVNVTDLLEVLGSSESREQGHQRLVQFTRIDLEAICRSQSLPVQKGDSVDLLRSRIVEHVIGSRLRSQAIRDSKVNTRD